MMRRCSTWLGCIALLLLGLVGCSQPQSGEVDQPSASQPTPSPPSTPTLIIPASPTAQPLPTLADAVELVKKYTTLVWTTDARGRITASGSGISLGEGKVLTNYHTVQGASEVWVRFADGHRDATQVLHMDSRRDLALLESAFQEMPSAPVADGLTLRAGDGLLAVGYPRVDAIGSQDSTLTRGVFSGRRELDGVWHVQTDTAVNPGNSGGPLTDTQGRLVGVVRLGVRGAVGLNYAVASDEVQAFLKGQSGATPPGLANATVPPLPAASPSIEQVVNTYYQAIDQRRYADAWAYLSSAAQRRQAYPDFEQQFSRTLSSIAVRSIGDVRVSGTTASLVAHTTTVSGGGVSRATECWRVEWFLVLEGGQWKRDRLSQTPETC